MNNESVIADVGDVSFGSLSSHGRDKLFSPQPYGFRIVLVKVDVGSF